MMRTEEKMRISTILTITATESFTRKARQESPRSVDSETVLAILEEAAMDEPLVIAAFGTRPDNAPGDYYMRECRQILIYRSKKFQKIEEDRLQAEEENRQREMRRRKLEAIIARLRTARELERRDIEAKDQAEEAALESARSEEIEREALRILEGEETRKNNARDLCAGGRE